VVSASVLDGGVAVASEDSNAGRVTGKVEVKTMTVSEALDEDDEVMLTPPSEADRFMELGDVLIVSGLSVTLTTLTVAVTLDKDPLIVSEDKTPDWDPIAGNDD